VSDIPKTPLEFNPAEVKPQWFHPFLLHTPDNVIKINKQELEAYAYDYFLRFLTLFRQQVEGDLKPGVVIEMSSRMRYKLGQAELFTHTIKLNQNYFLRDPRLLPYSLYHELVHLWLYDCHLDPGHTRRFYRKMCEFNATGLPVDPDVHIHTRLANESRFVYLCHECENRWYVNAVDKTTTMYCGFCYEKEGRKSFPVAYRNPKNPSPNRQYELAYIAK
jgi:predicted SprT family Zn-dependent metalloprotease